MSQKPTKTEIASACRDLIRRTPAAALSTALATGDGWPYGSLVTVALDCDLSPILLFSRLSDHTRNLDSDARASLLFEAATRRRNPQTGPRVTVMGEIKKTNVARHRRRFLARHPDAQLYAGFGDFAFYRMRIEKVHFVGGFARAHWLRGRDVVLPAKAAAAIAAAEEPIIAHMNDDHGAAIDHYANVLLGRRGKGWAMTGIDPDGCDLRLGGRYARLPFPAPIADRKAAREALVALANREK